MSQHDRSFERNAARRPARLGSVLGLIGLFLTLGLLLAGQAMASYESVGVFKGEPGPLLYRPSGIAVNYTGAGGVPVGTVYAINKAQHGGEPGGLVLSYDAQGKFRQAWGWGVADEEKEFERCGPAGEAAHPTCKGTNNTNKENEAAFAGEGAGQLSEPEGIAVDQASGDVYVFNKARAHNVVQIFTATGEPVGGFGETSGESIANSPEKIHGTLLPGRIAVDNSGSVYVGDVAEEARVMVFKPQTPGDLNTYAYTGQANDIGSIAYTTGPVALDEAGNVYLANGEFISEFPPGERTTPSCRYKVPGGQLAAMTVNPINGEVFARPYGGKIRQLAPCNAQGEFREKSSFAPASKAIYEYPLAIDPVLSYEPGRPTGIFYAGNQVAPETYSYQIEVSAPAVIHFPSIGAESVSAVTTTSAALHAQIDPEGSQTNYVFQYLTQAEYEANNPDEIQSLTVSAGGGAFSLGFEGHPSVGLPFDASRGEVRQGLEALPGIGAGNVAVSGGPGDEAGSSPYQVQFVGELSDTDLPPIEADGSGLSGGAATAVVQTENNGGGNGFAGAREAPPGGAVLGNGQEPLSASAGLVGLEPDTAYRYRVVASSPCNPDEEEVSCETFGKAESFRTFPSQAPGLPDHRAYELVSPADKAGGEVFRLNPWVASCNECNQIVSTAFPKQSSPDGEALVYEGSPFANSGTGLKENEYLARRTPSGWRSTNLTPPLLSTSGGGFQAFDTNFNRGLLAQVNPSLTPDAPSEYANLYGFSTTEPGALSPLIRAEPPNRSPSNDPSNALSLVYAGATPDLSHSLFEANDALTGETPSAPEAVNGGVSKYNLYESVEGELRLVNVLPGNEETVPGASFGSGLALANTAKEYDFDDAISADGSRIFWSDASGQVYVREDGERTRELSDHTGKFLTATPDGSEVLLSDGHLIGLGDEEPVVDLTEGKGGFEGIAGHSEDLSSIYFVDTAVLDGGENERGERAQAGQNNLYLFRNGGSRFIATLGADNNTAAFDSFGGDWRAVAGHRSAEASPNGRYLAFLSRARLTGFNHSGLCGFESGKLERVTGLCEEVFLYDSQSGRLSCPSCNPTGGSALGESTLPINDPIDSTFQAQPRYLTDEGRLYFNSQDSLSAFDTNEGVEDAYQYEPEGVGTCTRSGGCVDLISAGRESVDSNFYAMGDEGRDVFFTTRDQLALKDKDDLVDIYDAREGGGIASETETSRAECQGEACQPLASSPNDPTPASSTFEGAGNVHEASKAKKHAKKHKKKRHEKKKHAHRRATKSNRGGAK